MAYLIAKADGNIDGATTFAAVVTSAGAFLPNRNSLGTWNANANYISTAFTVTNGDVIDGVLFWIGVSNASTAGTLKIAINKGGVEQTSVTVNKADIHQYGASGVNNYSYAPVFFKFAGTATGDGAANWTLVATTAGGGSAITVLLNSGSTWTYALRTTTFATAVAGDNLAIVGELTGAGTHNERHITMNLTTAVTYGNGVVNNGTNNCGVILISSWGFLSYLSAPGQNYIFQAAADVVMGSNGYLDVCSTNAVAITTASPGVVTWTAHGFEANRKVRFRNTNGTLPTGIIPHTDYFVVGSSITTDTFQISATRDGPAVNTSGSPSGTHILLTGNPRNTTTSFKIACVADGNFGFGAWDYSHPTFMGLSRTVGKEVVKCKLTSTVAHSHIGTSASQTNTTITGTGPGPDGASPLCSGLVDTTANGVHTFQYAGPTVVNTTQTGTVFLGRGPGTNNRYARLVLGNSNALASVVNGCYVDIDLQLGTVGTPTAMGNGTATAANIFAVPGGFFVRLTGKVSSGSATSNMILAMCSAPGVTSFVGANNIGLFWGRTVIANGTLGDTTFNVDADSGWLANDVYCISGTNRWVAIENDSYSLKDNAGASSLVSALCVGQDNNMVTYTCFGRVTADIGLVTRNTKFSAVTPNVTTFLYAMSLSYIYMDWTEIYWIGQGSNTKYGIWVEAGNSAGTVLKTWTNCSIHNSKSVAFFCNTSNYSLNVNYSNNVVWHSAGDIFTISGTITLTDWIFDNNLVIRTTFNTYGANIRDVGGTFTNNTFAGVQNWPIVYGENDATVGVFDGNIMHGCGGGLQIANPRMRGTLKNTTSWRNSNVGYYFISGSAYSTELTHENLTLFGNASANFYSEHAATVSTITGTSIMCGDTSFSTTTNFQWTSAGSHFLNIAGVDMSGVGPGLAPAVTADFTLNTYALVMGTANNCKFGAPLLFNNMALLSRWSYLGYDAPNNHGSQLGGGIARMDTSIYHTNPPSMRMTPSSATVKLESSYDGRGILYPVDIGNALTVSVWIKKDTTYSAGAQPRLIVRANQAIGIMSDTVLAQCTDVSGATTTSVFDPATAVGITVTGSGLIATANGGGNPGVKVNATVGGKTSGKHYFEIALTGVDGGWNQAMGICTPASDYGSAQAGGTGISIWTANIDHGQIFSNGNEVANYGNQGNTGDLMGFAIDLDNRMGWFRWKKYNSGSFGAWNANGAANPVTNVGGIPIPDGVMVPFIKLGGYAGSTGSYTANFGATAFFAAAPSGFTSGWLSAVGIGTNVWVAISGTTPAATDIGVMEFIVDCDGASGYINIDDWAPTSGFVGIPPIYATYPTISVVGTSSAYVGKTLITTDGTWTATPPVSGYTYQWTRSGVAISGATASTYLIDAADVGYLLNCTVTATNANGSTPMSAVSSVGPITLHSPEYTQFYNRASTLNPVDVTHQNAYRTLIDGLVADGLWAKLDVLYLFAAQDSTTALLNVKQTSFTGVIGGAVTFAADRGMTGVDASNTWINTQMNPAANAATCKYLQNDCHLSVWSNTSAAMGASGGVMAGQIVGGGGQNYTLMIPRRGSNTNWFSVCSNAGPAQGSGITDGSGHFITSRSSSVGQTTYRNGAFLNSTTIGSNPPMNQVMGVLALEDQSTGPNSSTGAQCSAFSMGGSMDATQAANFYSHINTYMTAIGNGVVDPVAQFLSRTSGLDGTHITAYTDLINGLVSDGIWPKLDVLRIYATQNSATALLNLKSNLYTATVTGSPTFTVDRGYTGVDSSNTIYLDSNFNPVTAPGASYTQNSCHLATWTLNSTVMGAPDLGAQVTGGSSVAFIYSKYTDGHTYIRPQTTGASGGDAGILGNKTGFLGANRSSSVQITGYRNGSSIFSDGASASTALINKTFGEIGFQQTSNYVGCGSQQAMSSFGGSLTGAEWTSYYNRLRTYMLAVGAASPATEFIGRTTGLDTTHINAYTALIDGLVAAGIWAKLDVLHIYATQDSTTALMNLISSSYTGLVSGAVVFTADRGYAGVNNSQTVNINTQFSPIGGSPKFTQNSAHLSVWSTTHVAPSSNGGFRIGQVVGGATSVIISKFADGNAYYRITDNGSLAGIADSDGIGHYIASRNGSATTVQGYKNGSQVLNTTDNSVAPINLSFYTLATHEFGSGVGYGGTAGITGAASIGSGLTASDATNFYNLMRTYMTAVGVP